MQRGRADPGNLPGKLSHWEPCPREPCCVWGQPREAQQCPTFRESEAGEGRQWGEAHKQDLPQAGRGGVSPALQAEKLASPRHILWSGKPEARQEAPSTGSTHQALLHRRQALRVLERRGSEGLA